MKKSDKLWMALKKEKPDMLCSISGLFWFSKWLHYVILFCNINLYTWAGGFKIHQITLVSFPFLNFYWQQGLIFLLLCCFFLLLLTLCMLINREALDWIMLLIINILWSSPCRQGSVLKLWCFCCFIINQECSLESGESSGNCHRSFLKAKRR